MADAALNVLFDFEHVAIVSAKGLLNRFFCDVFKYFLVSIALGRKGS